MHSYILSLSKKALFPLILCLFVFLSPAQGEVFDGQGVSFFESPDFSSYMEDVKLMAEKDSGAKKNSTDSSDSKDLSTGTKSMDDSSSGGAARPFAIFGGLGASAGLENFGTGLDFEHTGGFHLKLGVELDKLPLAIEFQFDYFVDFEADINSSITVDLWTYNFVAKYFIPLPVKSKMKIRLYPFVGLGYFEAEREAGNTAKDEGFSLKFGGGVEVSLNKQMSVGMESGYNQFFGDEDESDDENAIGFFTFFFIFRV